MEILEKKSLLANILQSDCVAVNSLHHQSPNVVPPTLKATGYAEDKVIEVLEAVDHPFGLGVQWHPETLIRESENHPFSLPILLSFMEKVHEVSSK